jgi:succinate-acetate transporter protein
VVLFLMLAAGHAFHLGESFEHLTGFEGIFCGASACYTGLAHVLNELAARTILPLGAVKTKPVHQSGQDIFHDLGGDATKVAG